LLTVSGDNAGHPTIPFSGSSSQRTRAVQHLQTPQTSCKSACSGGSKLKLQQRSAEAGSAWREHPTVRISYNPGTSRPGRIIFPATGSSMADLLVIIAAAIGFISAVGIVAALLYMLLHRCLASRRPQSTLTTPLLPTTNHSNQQLQHGQHQGHVSNSVVMPKRKRWHRGAWVHSPFAVPHLQPGGAAPLTATHQQQALGGSAVSSAAIPGLTPLPGSSDSGSSPTPPEVSSLVEPPSLVEAHADPHLSHLLGHTLPHDLVTPATISRFKDRGTPQPQATGLSRWVQWVRGKAASAEGRHTPGGAPTGAAGTAADTPNPSSRQTTVSILIDIADHCYARLRVCSEAAKLISLRSPSTAHSKALHATRTP
jgi:hypothetical protein